MYVRNAFIAHHPMFSPLLTCNSVLASLKFLPNQASHRILLIHVFILLVTLFSYFLLDFFRRVAI